MKSKKIKVKFVKIKADELQKIKDDSAYRARKLAEMESDRDDLRRVIESAKGIIRVPNKLNRYGDREYDNLSDSNFVSELSKIMGVLEHQQGMIRPEREHIESLERVIRYALCPSVIMEEARQRIEIRGEDRGLGGSTITGSRLY